MEMERERIYCIRQGLISGLYSDIEVNTVFPLPETHFCLEDRGTLAFLFFNFSLASRNLKMGG